MPFSSILGETLHILLVAVFIETFQLKNIDRERDGEGVLRYLVIHQYVKKDCIVSEYLHNFSSVCT